MGTQRRVGLAVSGLLLGVLALAGCAQGGPGSPSPSSPGGTVSSQPDPSASPTPGPQPSPTGPSKTTPGSTGKSEIQLTGRLEQGVERCTILRTDDGQSYEMMGGGRLLPEIGTRVRVRGVIRTDVMSFCMQGPIVEVLEIHPV